MNRQREVRAEKTSNVLRRVYGMKEFPPFRLDTVNECLWRQHDGGDEERIRLTPKAFAVLRYLAEHAGRLVTQSELLEAVWPETFVQPEVLKSQILDVRHALGDDPKNPRFIETLPKRGYHFIAAVGDVSALAEPVNESDSGKIVGRDPQLDELHSCLERSLANRRQVVFVTGETGIGKTTLVDEFVRRVTADCPDIRIARGQCVEGYGSKEAYYPVLEALSQLCGSSRGDTVVHALASLAPTWLVQFPAHVRHEQREMLHQEIVGATWERMLREISEALETISSEKPLLLVLEDLHWGDRSTVDLISALARRRSSAKLLLICTYRPVDVTLARHPLKTVKQDLLVHQLCREIALEPLTEAEVATYLQIETPGAAVPRGLAELIYRHSEGNPLFMVSVLDDLRDRDMIAVENGTWQIRVPLESIHLETPESLREMIELQIEKLSADERRVLEVASISGRLFTAKATPLGATVDNEKFENTCEDLARRQHMVRRSRSHPLPDGTISQCYEFVHAFYGEVFYWRQAPSRWGRVCIEGTPAHSFLTT
jgi:DNA-binding winged helix-turn-helix (wHTH) protein